MQQRIVPAKTGVKLRSNRTESCGGKRLSPEGKMLFCVIWMACGAILLELAYRAPLYEDVELQT